MVIPARKRWGQHFLARGETAERIVAAARLAPSDTVLEVGPGEGALTRPIAALARRLEAVLSHLARVVRQHGAELGLAREGTHRKHCHDC